jgi:glutamate-1-semialdehyde 2,1-aminomutase
MHAIRLARGFTGKPNILKFEGHYHGNHDAVLVSVGGPPGVLGHRHAPVRLPVGSGIPAEAYANTLVAVWNDVDLLRRVVRRHRDELAAIITEPIMANKGSIVPEPGYLPALQEVLFILDEVITGFRLAPGGAQEHFGLRPDLTTFAKALGNGIPIAAFAGRREIMQAVEAGVRHAGTYNAAPVGLAAAKATLDVLAADGGAVYKSLYALGQRLMDGLRAIFERHGHPVVLQGPGPMFQFYFTEAKRIRDYRDACSADLRKFQRFAHAMIARGVWVHPDGFEHWFLSAAHTPADIDRILTVAEDAAKAVR